MANPAFELFGQADPTAAPITTRVNRQNPAFELFEQPGTPQSVKQEEEGWLSRVIRRSGAELETLGDPANPEAAKAVLQAEPTLASGAVSWIPAGLSMFSFDTRGLEERAKTATDIQEALTIKPPTKLAEDVVRGVAYPIALAAKAGEEAGGWLEEKGYPLLGAAARTAGEAAPFIIPGIPKAVKEIRGSTWYRKLTIKERGLVDPYIESMAADIASGDLTTAEIRELWKDPVNREELLKRYQGVGGEATGNVKASGEPVRASGADVVGELPAGQGFQLRPTQAEIRDLLATMAEEGPKALPPGQGFQLVERPPIAPQVTALEKEIASNEAWIAKNAAFKGTPMHNGISARLDDLRAKLSELTGEEIKAPAEGAAPPPEIVQPEPTSQAAEPLALTPRPPSVPVKTQAAKAENAQGIIGRINAEGGINVYDGYNAPEMRQFPDMARVMKKDGRPPDEWAQILNDEGYNVGTGDDLIELIKSGKARQTYAPDKADALMERDLLKLENEWAERQAGEGREFRPGTEGVEGAKTEGAPDSQEAGGGITEKQAERLIADGAYVTGRAGTQDLMSEFSKHEIYVSHEMNVADYYAGEKGSKWLIKPKKGAKILDATDDALVINVVDKLREQYKNGELDNYSNFRNLLKDEIDTYGEKKAWERVHESLQPKDIVNDEGFYSDTEFINWLYENFEYDFVKTNRGGVAYNPEAVDIQRIIKDGKTIKADPFERVPAQGIKRKTAEVKEKTDKGIRLYSGLDPVAAYESLRGLKNNIKEAMPHLEALGRSIYESGKQTFLEWQTAIKTKLGDLWESFKDHMKAVWETVRRPLRNEKGAVGIGPMVEGIRNASAEVKKVASEVKKTADEYLGSISTRLGNIDPSLKYTLRNFEFQRGMKADDRARRVTPFMEKTAKMTPEDKAAFDIARKNGDPAELKRLVTKYGIGKEHHDLRVVLKELYDQAKAVGYDVGYRPNYHPRVLKDPEGFLQYFYKQKDWPVLEKAIREKETQLQRYLTDEEKAHLINNMLRGYPSGQISLSKPGQLKERQIKTIWPEINKFYMDSDAALLRYISDVTDAIEARKLFGKTAKGGKIADVKDTIGGYVLDLLQKGKIKPEQERPLREILDARFNEVGTRGVFGLYKNLSYLDTMGSPISAITQIGDLAWALYRNGVGPTVAATGKAIAGRSMLKKEDIGVGRIASEFADSSKAARAVDNVFRMIGLERIDAIGKESLISSTYAKARAMAAKDPAKLAAELKPIFEGETAQVVADLKAGKITENVKLYLFNTLADFQPIALSEMPAKYLTGGNGRIFYQLKTFTLKQFDVFRREAFQKMATEGERAEGVKNLVKLSGALVAANASADVIKDLLLGRPLDLPDKVVDNLMRLVGVSKFATWKAREEGPGTAAVLMAAPPFKAINAIYKDIMTAGDEKGLESVQSIPLVGKLYYWWFGKGAGKSQTKKASSGGGELKELKTLKGGLK